MTSEVLTMTGLKIIYPKKKKKKKQNKTKLIAIFQKKV